jgi:hypothetical protein
MIARDKLNAKFAGPEKINNLVESAAGSYVTFPTGNIFTPAVP